MVVAHIGTICELTMLTRSRSMMESMLPDMLERGLKAVIKHKLLSERQLSGRSKTSECVVKQILELQRKG
jgi:hypothetical protein